ncbi:Dol-P-Man:Man-PP-Dol alpha-1,6-mannosyltransferase [Golovinomyces cichoracearum]|uniref:Dol-P-Man:Man-PP-Dol alpha-1,6-mannosyltransferase n=1 Tax=Golovinomyces cichoracearum TaxID=62708 RepID=A0A420IU84_9PEZI|nr:Dol-P-Man:Man-PP-Dol alpha-1,6-mannosyltransferase [Golovinomyces cichoracearum]
MEIIVEESSNLQATHDILNYGLPATMIDTFQYLRQHYVHFSFPGVVPRTFIGALTLAILSKPLILLSNANGFYTKLTVRGVMGLLNATALTRYKIPYQRSMVKIPEDVTFAMRDILCGSSSEQNSKSQDRLRRGIFLMIFAATVFHSEIMTLLFSQLSNLLLDAKISLQAMILICIKSASISILIMIAVDSYFW